MGYQKKRIEPLSSEKNNYNYPKYIICLIRVEKCAACIAPNEEL